VRFDPTSAECLVFTYAEGALSVLAHDLKITVERFSIVVDDASAAVRASFAADSLRVVAAVRADGREDHGALAAGDRRQIERTIVETVLEADRHPEIRFASTAVTGAGAGLVLAGRLALHGHERTVRVAARTGPVGLVAETKLHQPDFGIVPYRAMLGALRVKPDVLIRVIVPPRPPRAS
jgi:hypothetical protein